TRGGVLRASVLAFVARGAIFAIWLLVPFYLVDTRGLGASVGGIFFMLTPLGAAVAAPMGGRVADRVGASAPAVAGLVMQTAGLGSLGFVDGATPLWLIAPALFVAGFGLGFFEVPNMTTIMAAFPPGRQGAAGGLAFLTRTLGVVAGVALLGELVAARSATVGFLGAFEESLRASAVAVGAAFLFAVAGARRGGRRGAILRGHEGVGVGWAPAGGGVDGGLAYSEAVPGPGCRRRDRVLLPAGLDRRSSGRAAHARAGRRDARGGAARPAAADRVHHEPGGVHHGREGRDQRGDGRLQAGVHGGSRGRGRGDRRSGVELSRAGDVHRRRRGPHDRQRPDRPRSGRQLRRQPLRSGLAREPDHRARPPPGHAQRLRLAPGAPRPGDARAPGQGLVRDRGERGGEPVDAPSRRARVPARAETGHGDGPRC